jgi:capsular exopolysaccharide synthesis family protein
MAVAQSYVKSLTVAPTSKQTSIAELTLTNTNTRRAIDFLTQLVQCYNAQANADKNEVALKTEEFINSRLEKIDAELGSTESSLEQYKRRNAVTELSMDAGQSLQMSSQYATKLSEANSQIQLLDYLREFVDNHNNLYKIIPSNVGMTDQASTTLITSYNQTVQERNRLLKAASAQAPQVQTLTSTLDELQSAIRTALLQARRSADIQRQGIQNQYAKYQGRIGSTPEQERVLNQIGRQQEVKSGLYLLLLQKREENSISLAATADKGRMIDEPQFGGKVSPKSAIIILAAIILGVGIPFLILYLIQLMSYRIEGHDDVARITDLPIIVDVPVANENVKDVAGIVVRANKNSQMDEIFRSMRTNLLFMMKEDENTILFTSSTSGEGKTFLAANLAVSFALLGKKVILCGLDIRKPALGRLFDLKDRTTGITQLLVKDQVTEQDINTTICPSGVNENLDLLLAGPTPPNPTELLARETFGNIMEILKKKYDYVILDTAPVGLVTDTLQIGRYANVSCFVVRADYTPKSNIGMVNQLTAEEKMKNTCLILNGVDMSKKKYGYYYGYGKYGKYGRYGYGRHGYGRYGYGRYGYGNYGSYGYYADSHYGNKNDDSIKK